MNRTFAAALLTLCLAPTPALAEAGGDPPAAAAPTAPAAEPTAPWSMGAGVSFGGSFISYASLGATLVPPAAPGVRATVERAVAPGWWLVAGAFGNAERRRGEAPDVSIVTTRDDRVAAALALGVRRALTRREAPVCVSIDASAVGGYIATHTDWSSGAIETQRGEAWQAGLMAGLAVERELTAGLSLRIGTPLLSVGWARGTVRTDSVGRVTQQGFSANMALAPWLELRQAF